MIDPVSALVHTGVSIVHLFTRNRQTEQASLVLRTRQEQDAKNQQLQFSIQQRQLKLDEDRLVLQRMQMLGQVKQIELLRGQIESQRVQIEIETKQLNLQLQAVVNSQRSLENQAQSLRMQGEMLNVLNLQYVLLFLISIIALIWLGIQVFPVVFPLLKTAFTFVLKEAVILKDGFISLMRFLLQVTSQAVHSIVKFSIELFLAIKAWTEDALPILLNFLHQLVSQLVHTLSNAFSLTVNFFKNLTVNAKGWIGGSIAILVYSLCLLTPRT